MTTDWRNVTSGRVIPTQTYSDQPYIIKTDDGAWLCTVTTGVGHEGEPGQHVVAMRSTDQGKTWSAPVPLEPADGPEASYSVMFKTSFGRIYCFYNHNTDQLKSVKRENGLTYKRVDTLGYYVFKYSDDQGRTWSPKRYNVPVREFEVDRNNVYAGKVRFLWNVGRPVTHAGNVIITLHKVAAIGEGYIAQSEGVFLRSPNLQTERDPEKITFDTFPEGDIGIRAPDGIGRIAEEHSLVTLSDGSLFCIYRTVAGYPAYVISRDGARTWSTPAFMAYAPGGPLIKHPRAATFIWRCQNGKYLLWFHNHGGLLLRGNGTPDMPPGNPFDDRNPVWVCAGQELDTPQGKTLTWSQPEILFYHDDIMIRMSYPDLVEENGELFFTTTHKTTAHVLPVDKAFLTGLWGHSHTPPSPTLDHHLTGPQTLDMPKLPRFTDRDHSKADFPQKQMRTGLTLSLDVTVLDAKSQPILFDTMTPDGRGICLRALPDNRAELTLSDGRTITQWSSDIGSLPQGKASKLTAIIDAGPNIIQFIIDAKPSLGGDQRQFGWGRLNPNLTTPAGSTRARISPDPGATVTRIRIFPQALKTFEAATL